MSLRALGAGALYFAIVFTLAFGFGVVRTLLLEPALGQTLAVACELPFLLAAILFGAGFVLRRFPAVRGVTALLIVGIVGLALQQGAELAMVLLRGQTLAAHLEYLSSLAGRLYLGAVAIFAVAPLILGVRR